MSLSNQNMAAVFNATLENIRAISAEYDFLWSPDAIHEIGQAIDSLDGKSDQFSQVQLIEIYKALALHAFTFHVECQKPDDSLSEREA